MKVRYVKELSKVEIHIETVEHYHEDYQMSMIRENEIASLANAKVLQIDGRTTFIYDVSGMTSLKSRYEGQELKYADIKNIVESLLKTVTEIKGYLLNPDCLVLEPGLIFTSMDEWVFLYLPAKKSNLNIAFHGLTEYFVRTLDYKEEEGIVFASFLHKETLQENFNLEQTLTKYETYKIFKKEKKRKSNEIKDETKKGNYTVETDEEYDFGKRDYFLDVNRERESKLRISILDKVRNRFAKKNWGDWDDLILEEGEKH